jgi:hypothetical protein
MWLRYHLTQSSRQTRGGEPRPELSQLLVLSPRLRQMFGMTSITERAYLLWYARNEFADSGAIVELGCWLGSTTMPLAMGLAENPKVNGPRPRIYSYDNFRWDTKLEPLVAGTSLAGRFRDGDSFQHEFESRVARWRESIIVCAGDLAVGHWEHGPIEFLLVDAMKSWALANRTLDRFYPAMIPGRSLLFHQDFAHWFTPWIHLTHFRLRRYFQMVYEVPRSSSVVFRLREAIPRELTSTQYSYAMFDNDEIDAAFDYSMSLVSSDKHASIAAAKVMCLLQSGDLDRAERELARCRTQGLDFTNDLSFVEGRMAGLRPVA